MTTVAEIVIAADVAAWRRIGLPVDIAGRARIGTVGIRFVEPDSVAMPDGSATGIVSWSLMGAPTSISPIDGLATDHLSEDFEAPAAPGAPVELSAVPLEILGFDHVVVMTDDLERTCGSIEAATGAALKRIREVGPLRQGFHRLGEVIVEVVTRPDVPAGPASFWGFVINVADIDPVAAHVGPDVLSPPKDAVQPGRRIASFRVEAGLGLPVALMTV